MTTTQNGSYGASIHTRNDGEGYDVSFLYNMGTAINEMAAGDVWERKTYKTMKTVERKIAAYYLKQGVA